MFVSVVRASYKSPASAGPRKRGGAARRPGPARATSQASQHPRTGESSGAGSMNIQKIEESGDPQQPIVYAGHGQVMSVPDVGAPRTNPLTMIWRRKGIVAVAVIACVLVAMVKY